MKKSVLLILLLFFVLNLSAKEEDITLDTGTGKIYGTLTVPATDRQVPVVIIIAGSGPTDQDGNNPSGGLITNTYRLIAYHLRENGIASLRFDKRGIGISRGAISKEEDLTIDTYADDVRGWVHKLSEEGRFSEIILLGHSEGARIGVLAARDNDNVSKMISVAGAGENMADVLARQLQSSLPEAMLEESLRVIDSLRNGKYVENFPPELAGLFRKSVQPYMISMFSNSPAEEISKLTIPILVVQGDTDFQGTIDDAQILADSNPNTTLVIIPEMNHTLKHSLSIERHTQQEAYTNPSLPLKEEFTEAVVKFIKEGAV
ncbi:MAG: alpha/beta fold hydrolase [Rikenellaceae bacterium]|nr:alpha/beta fold hydrolase [Rikenellaceae bacterium]